MIFIALLLWSQAASPDKAPPVHPGAKSFAMSCAVGYCHGAAGAANRGPRLRGRDFERSYVDRVVRLGIPNSAMPGFEGRMKKEELEQVIDYVMLIARETTASSPAEPVAVIGEQPGPSARKDPPVPPPANALFFDATRQARCSTCHEWAGKGTPVVPISAGTAIPTKPTKVKRITLSNGDTFPGIINAEDSGLIRIYDLTTPPPVLRTFSRSDVASIEPEKQWTHAEATREYSSSQLKEIMSSLGSAQQ